MLKSLFTIPEQEFSYVKSYTLPASKTLYKPDILPSTLDVSEYSRSNLFTYLFSLDIPYLDLITRRVDLDSLSLTSEITYLSNATEQYTLGNVFQLNPEEYTYSSFTYSGLAQEPILLVTSETLPISLGLELTIRNIGKYSDLSLFLQSYLPIEKLYLLDTETSIDHLKLHNFEPNEEVKIEYKYVNNIPGNFNIYSVKAYQYETQVIELASIEEDLDLTLLESIIDREITYLPLRSYSNLTQNYPYYLLTSNYIYLIKPNYGYRI